MFLWNKNFESSYFSLSNKSLASLKKLFSFALAIIVNKNKVISTVANHGNTSAASIPIAIDNAIKRGKVKNGNILAFQAIGGGLSWGSLILKIGKPS